MAGIDDSTPKNNTLLAPSFQQSASKDFAMVSPNNIINQPRMRVGPNITPLTNNNRSLMGSNQVMGSFDFGHAPPRFGGGI